MKCLLDIMGVAAVIDALVYRELLVPGDDEVIEYPSESESS